MLRYVLQRLAAMGLTLFVILTIAFLVIRLMPGSIYEDPYMTEELYKIIEARYHLNEPMIVQYGIFLQNIARGDWGTSIKLQPRMPVWNMLSTRVPITVRINVVALAAALPIGILAGIFSAMFRNTKVDYFISALVVLFISVPSFVFATLLQYGLAFRFGWFPIIYDPRAVGLAVYITSALPIMALSFSPIARIARFLRGELIETLGSDFMLLARTKGLTQFQATVRHALRNSLLPVVSILIPMFLYILTGSLVVEKIFAIPGVGGLLVNSINANDHTVTIAVMIVYSVVALLTILLVDLSYGLIDPRVRMGGGKSD